MGSPPPAMHVMALALVLALLFFMCSTSGATTHLMLEPSGGRAVLVEKRSPKEVTRQPEIIEVMPAPAEEKKGQDKKEDTKRAAILLDKIMYAVQKALDENKVPGKEGITLTPEDLAAFSGGGLERRGNAHNRVYWRCYFNAVSCF